MSPWLFNVYMDGVAREVNVRVGEGGLGLSEGNGTELGCESGPVC